MLSAIGHNIPISTFAAKMSFPNIDFEDSIAKGMNLVFEISGLDGNHRGSIIIEQSRCQFYDTLDNHRNRHFTLLQHYQVPSYIKRLVRRGFVAVPERDVCTESRPKGNWYMVLKEYRDYYTPEATVLNNIHRNPRFASIVKTIPFQWMAEEMFLRDYSNSKDSGVRGNLRWDEGRTGVCSNDKSVQAGMNVPNFITKNKKKSGERDNETRSDTIFRAACGVMTIAITASRTHPHPEWEIAMMPFSSNQDRAERFAMKCDEDKWQELCRSGIDPSCLCFEAASIIGTGETPNHIIKKTEPHTDNENARNDDKEWPTYNRCPTVVRLVDMNYAEGRGVEMNTGRVCANTYCKNAVTQSMNKMRHWEEVLGLLQSWIANRSQSSGRIPTYRKFAPPVLSRRDEDGTWSHPADENKDCFYSLFVNEILDLVDKEDGPRDEVLMIEALYLMVFTPSPNRYREAIQEGYARFVQQRQLAEEEGIQLTNLFSHCISYLKETHGTVGGGPNMRYRPQKDAPERDDLFQSLANLRTAIHLANRVNNTEWLVKRMTKKPDKGGIFGVGHFHAQQLIDVATKVGLITWTHHVENVCVSGSTNTAKVLKTVYHIKEDDMMGLSVYLAASLSRTPSEVENMLCEAIRWRHNADTGARDVFAPGHNLFVVRGGHVLEIGYRGWELVREFPCTATVNDIEYGEEWWTGGWHRSALNDVDYILGKSRVAFD